MTNFTRVDLTRLMRESAGVDESVDLEGDILDIAFEDLGYDSLAMLEIAARIEQEYHVRVGDDEVGRLETPRMMIDYVHGQAAAVQ